MGGSMRSYGRLWGAWGGVYGGAVGGNGGYEGLWGGVPPAGGAVSDMLRSRGSLGGGPPLPPPGALGSDPDFLRSLLHHFQSGWALK